MAPQPVSFDELWHEYRRCGTQAAKAQLTSAFMPLMARMARRVRRAMGGRPDLQDLVNAGVVGLLEAIERFEPERGVWFETFASIRALGAMHDDQRKFDWASSALRLKALRVRKAAEELARARGRTPTDAELAQALGLSSADVAHARRHTRYNAPLSLDASTQLASPALEDSSLDPMNRLLAQEARTLLLDAVKGLPDKQRYVLLLYYFERLKMAQIGLVLGVTESRVCQLHREALERLLRRLGPRRDELLDALST